jgi:hypothetical protein
MDSPLPAKKQSIQPLILCSPPCFFPISAQFLLTGQK